MRGSLPLAARILSAAKTLFVKQGYTETTTRDIARHAGTSESGVFRVYRDKHEVLLAVYEGCWEEVHQVIDAALARCGTDPREQIMAAVRAYWKMYGAEPYRLTMIFLLKRVGGTDAFLSSDRNHNGRSRFRHPRQIYELCHQATAKGLDPLGGNGSAFGEAVVGIAEAFLVAWYATDSGGRTRTAIPLKEAVNVLEAIVWRNASARG